MKRIIGLWVGLFLLQGATLAYASQPGTPEYEKMKEYKKSQREKKAAGPVEKNFFQKEAERSGLAGSVMAVGHIAGSVVPLEKPNANK